MLTIDDIHTILKKPKQEREKLYRANQELREARLDACANGAIRYDKDKVMSSPNDEMLNNKVARIIEAEKEARQAQIDFYIAKKEALKLIDKIEDEDVKDVCRRYYVDLNPVRHIGAFLFLSERTIWRHLKQGVEEIDHKMLY